MPSRMIPPNWSKFEVGTPPPLPVGTARIRSPSSAPGKLMLAKLTQAGIRRSGPQCRFAGNGETPLRPDGGSPRESSGGGSEKRIGPPIRSSGDARIEGAAFRPKRSFDPLGSGAARPPGTGDFTESALDQHGHGGILRAGTGEIWRS